jgi:hypothetical protein
VSYAIIAVNCLLFLLELATGRHLQELLSIFGFIPARFLALRESQIASDWALYLPFLTTMFLHGSWLHLLGNMWTLFIFGDNVEDTLGHGRFLLFYLACGVGGSLLHLFFSPYSWIPLVGASGAIAGVMGAYLLLFPRARILILLPIIIFFPIIEVPASVFLVFWFLLQFFSGAFSILGPRAEMGGVAFWAHTGGFLAGVLLVILLASTRLQNPFRQRD